MSVIADHVPTGFTDGGSVDERNAQRYNGFLIAVAASIALWGGLGAGIWGIVSLFS